MFDFLTCKCVIPEVVYVPSESAGINETLRFILSRRFTCI